MNLAFGLRLRRAAFSILPQRNLEPGELMPAGYIKPKKIVFHSRLLPHETCRMNRVQHLKTKKGFLVFSDSGFMTYQPKRNQRE
jgi:hypothetical protein